MLNHPKTAIIARRMVSFDGGSTYKDVIRLTDEELAEHWPRVLARMEPTLRQSVEAELPEANHRYVLARYLELSGSHLVVG